MNNSADRFTEASRARRSRQREALRRSILETAARLVLERGYAAFSLREVAYEIGYTPTTIYRYFAGKDDLLAAVISESFAELGERLERAARRVRDPVRRIAALGDAYVRFALDRPVQYRLMFVERLDLLAARAAPKSPNGFEVLRVAVADAVRDKQLVSTDVETLSQTLWASVHGVVSLALADGPFFPKRRARRVHELCQRAILSGLKRRSR